VISAGFLSIGVSISPFTQIQLDGLMKLNPSDTDFRKSEWPDVDPGCLFCPEKVTHRIVEEYNTVFAIKDGYPVSEGHHLIIPRRHTSDWFSMTENERRDSDALIRILRSRLSESDPTITGFNIGMNCGTSAGQSIFHAHIHLIPRRDGDTPHPRGGVRGVIPRRMGY
jgi:diadenosine tetraphosphate (Ap4A) HIT family hydrolase